SLTVLDERILLVDKTIADWKEPTSMEAKLFELDAKMAAVRAKMEGFPDRVLKDYQDKLDVSWIYHDHALEGVVLSYSELKAAIDKRIISDVTLIPMYEEIKNYKSAIEWVRELAKQPLKKRKGSITVETLKAIHTILTP